METESPSTEQSPSPEPSGAPVRSTNDRLVGGVCAGLAAVLGLDAAVVRVAAIVLAVTGTGMPLYAVGYVLMSEGVTEPQVDDAPSEVRRALGLALVVVGLVSTQAALNLAPPAAVVWPVVVVGIGVGVVVWRTDWEFGSTRSEALRIAAGILVVGAGVAALVAGSISFDAVRSSILAIGLVVGGLALIVGPWIAVVLNDRSEERRRRLQADARADMAAHLHDSVLQTFALIQRTDDPRRITQLARQQERELRRWLYAVSDDPGATTLRSSIESAAAGVEDRFDVTVSTVVVGDAAMTPALDALVAATSEAATNASKWSGSDQVSVFAEVEDDGVRVFVRDTGVGFDPAAVADDRLGVRESIIGRMERTGGTATITSSPGTGTEVELFAPAPPSTRRDTV